MEVWTIQNYSEVFRNLIHFMKQMTYGCMEHLGFRRWSGRKVSQLHWTHPRGDTRLVQKLLFSLQERKLPGHCQHLYQTANMSHFMEIKTITKLWLLFTFAGVLWLAVISEFMYIGLLVMGFLLMCVEAMCLCAKKEMSSLKINAFAAMCTVLSGESFKMWMVHCFLFFAVPPKKLLFCA